MSRIVIYHGNCPDGFTAAWVAWQTYGNDAQYIPAMYGDAPPDVNGADVLIVDFSYPKAALDYMALRAKTITIFDHHKTAKEDLANVSHTNVRIVFDMDRSGAGITWDELNPHEGRPWLVDYVEDRDLWKFALPQSKAINAWVSCVPRTFKDWDEILELGSDAAEMQGRAVLRHIDGYVAAMSHNARVISLYGWKVPCVNASYPMISELVGHLAEGHPFAIGWSLGADCKVRVSLRSRSADGADVSAIAKAFGGGGHKNAAGFELDLGDPAQSLRFERLLAGDL